MYNICVHLHYVSVCMGAIKQKEKGHTSQPTTTITRPYMKGSIGEIVRIPQVQGIEIVFKS